MEALFLNPIIEENVTVVEVMHILKMALGLSARAPFGPNYCPNTEISHHTTSNLKNLALHFDYEDLDQILDGNATCLHARHIA